MNLPTTPTRAPTSAVEAEAAGEATLVAVYHGHEVKLPADVELWPLERIANCVGMRGNKLIADHGAIAAILRDLLGAGQWIDWVRAHPKRRDLVPMSTCCAMAAGFDRRDDDLAFAAMPRLLATLRRYPAAVEATLAGYGVDYRDRWHLDDDGRRLTLRRIHVLLSHADPDSPLGIAQNGGKRPLNGTEIVLMDLYEAMTQTRHPSRPMTAEALVERSSNTVNIEAEREKYRDRTSKRRDRRTTAVETARQWAKPEKGIERMSATAKKQKLEAVDDEKIVEAVADVDEAIAAAEVEPELVTIKFRDVGFTIPKLMDEWETEACLAMNEGNYVSAAKQLLGRGQWAQLMALGDKRKDIREFLRIFADVVDEECIA